MKSLCLFCVIFNIIAALQIAVDQEEEAWSKLIEECKSQFIKAMVSYDPKPTEEVTPELEALASCMRAIGLIKNSKIKPRQTPKTTFLENLYSGETCFNAPVCIRPKNKE